MASSRFLMRSRDNIASAVRCGAERIFQPTKAEWRSIRLPSGVVLCIYYLIRLLRVGRQTRRKDRVGGVSSLRPVAYSV